MYVLEFEEEENYEDTKLGDLSLDGVCVCWGADW